MGPREAYPPHIVFPTLWFLRIVISNHASR